MRRRDRSEFVSDPQRLPKCLKEVLLFLLEAVANRKKQLTAVVFYFADRSDIVLCRRFTIDIVRKRMEVTLLRTVLVRQVDIPVVNIVAQAAGEAVGCLPVGVVSAAGIVDTRRVDEVAVVVNPLHALIIIVSTLVVVAHTEREIADRLIFSTQFEQAHALERLAGVLVHVGIVMRVGDDVIIIPVDALSVDDACLGRGVVSILIGSTERQLLADGVSERKSEFPRCEDLVVV